MKLCWQGKEAGGKTRRNSTTADGCDKGRQVEEVMYRRCASIQVNVTNVIQSISALRALLWNEGGSWGSCMARELA